MENTLNDILMITHADDLDGRSCAIVLPFAVNQPVSNIDFAFHGYKTVDKYICDLIDSGKYKDYKIIYITDLGITLETAEKIDSVVDGPAMFIFIDHHDSNEELNKYSWADVTWVDETGRKISATKLLFKRYRDLIDKSIVDTLEEYVNNVSDYDTFTWMEENNIQPKKFHVLLSMYGHQSFVSQMFAKIADNGPLLTEDDDTLATLEIEREESAIQMKLKTVKYIDFQGYRVGVLFEDNMAYISMLGNRACQLLDIDFCAMISLSWRKVNLRSIRNDIHLGKQIAKQFKGGGHPKAAGFELTDELAFEVINKVFTLGEE